MASLAFHTATTGVMEHQKALDSLAHNIANVNTYGYKEGLESFQDLLYTKVDSVTEPNVTVGHGARLAKTDTSFVQGTLAQTERNLDLAFDVPNGFFRVVMANGDVAYTRNGNFELREYGDGFLLVSGAYNGYITDANGNAILLQGSTDEYIEDLEYIVGKFSFDNLDGLWRNDNGSFSETVASGAATFDDSIKLRQGYLEASNVDYANEITEVIKVQRSFQMNSRMITITDEIVDTINNLR